MDNGLKRTLVVIEEMFDELAAPWIDAGKLYEDLQRRLAAERERRAAAAILRSLPRPLRWAAERPRMLRLIWRLRLAKPPAVVTTPALVSASTGGTVVHQWMADA